MTSSLNSKGVDRLVFAANLDALRAVFGDVPFISVDEAAGYLKIARETLLSNRSFPLKAVTERRRVVPVAQLARWLSA